MAAIAQRASRLGVRPKSFPAFSQFSIFQNALFIHSQHTNTLFIHNRLFDLRVGRARAPRRARAPWCRTPPHTTLHDVDAQVVRDSPTLPHSCSYLYRWLLGFTKNHYYSLRFSPKSDSHLGATPKHPLLPTAVFLIFHPFRLDDSRYKRVRWCLVCVRTRYRIADTGSLRGTVPKAKPRTCCTLGAGTRASVDRSLITSRRPPPPESAWTARRNCRGRLAPRNAANGARVCGARFPKRYGRPLQ